VRTIHCLWIRGTDSLDAGTGKSFIGALLAKFLHDQANSRILVVCYTNHALDQFLEDLLDIGIPESSMVRLGGKSTPRTERFSLQKIQNNSYKFNKSDWNTIDSCKQRIRELNQSLKQASDRYKQYNPNFAEILDFLELDDEDGEYFDAFQLPPSEDGGVLVGRKGKAIGPYYLISQWVNGWDAGVLKEHQVVADAEQIWRMPIGARQEKFNLWKDKLLREQVSHMQELAKRFNEAQRELDSKFDERVGHILSQKQIIGCTTTAAAKYREHIKAGAPNVLLVEEAGEILESHVLTAMSPEIKKVILIGDHKYAYSSH
jgi:hypothetical protein